MGSRRIDFDKQKRKAPRQAPTSRTFRLLQRAEGRANNSGYERRPILEHSAGSLRRFSPFEKRIDGDSASIARHPPKKCNKIALLPCNQALSARIFRPDGKTCQKAIFASSSPSGRIPDRSALASSSSRLIWATSGSSPSNFNSSRR